MFRRFAGNIPVGANSLFRLHPSELTVLLESAWEGRAQNPALPSPLPQPPFALGHPLHRSDIPQLHTSWLRPLLATRGLAGPPGPTAPTGGVVWDHLIYAYMIENTRIYEIFRRVLHDLVHGEKLGSPTAAAQHWLRNTEELFYRDPPPFAITAVSSHIRSDLRGSRRNAYQRMFGMDLNHGTDDGKPYPYTRAEAANNEFVTTFEEFLREVWVGITNVLNTSGPNPTDPGKIANLAEKLHDMLRSRRQNGNLSREEFAFVSMMSWFHLTVEFNSPIVEALRAEAEGPEQRLFKIAERVGLPAHGLSKSYFDIADPISLILILIETRLLNTAGAVPPLFTGGLEQIMRTIITHWSIITGRDVKAGKVAPS